LRSTLPAAGPSPDHTHAHTGSISSGTDSSFGVESHEPSLPAAVAVITDDANKESQDVKGKGKEIEKEKVIDFGTDFEAERYSNDLLDEFDGANDETP